MKFGHEECEAENILTALSAISHSSEILKSVGLSQLSEESRQILEFASEFRKNEKSIDTLHLSLGVIALDGGITKQIFSESKVDIEALKARLYAFNG